MPLLGDQALVVTVVFVNVFNNKKWQAGFAVEQAIRRAGGLADFRQVIFDKTLHFLLPKLLASNLNVSLVDLKTQAPAVFFSSAQQTKQAKPGPTTKSNALQPSPSTPVNQSTIYRSAVDVSLEGSFPDLLSYLKTLEQRSAPLFWTGAVLEVKTYPQVALKLNITTLGVEAGSPLN